VRNHSVIAAIMWIAFSGEAAWPCSAISHYSPDAMVAASDLILRVTASEYSGPPPLLPAWPGPDGPRRSKLRIEALRDQKPAAATARGDNGAYIARLGSLGPRFVYRSLMTSAQ